MKYRATLEIIEDPKLLTEAFGPELRATSTERSIVTFSATKKSGVFTVQAEDSIALRASLVSITKLCQVYENMKGI